MRRSRRGALRLRPRRRRGTPACSAGRSPGTPRRTCDSFSTRGYGRSCYCLIVSYYYPLRRTMATREPAQR
eukprot:8931903-Pyramimonas_sp.AAC.1